MTRSPVLAKVRAVIDRTAQGRTVAGARVIEGTQPRVTMFLAAPASAARDGQRILALVKGRVSFSRSAWR